MTQYYPLITCNGVMYGDDYSIPSVKVAVDKWALKNKVKLEIYKGKINLVWIIKKICDEIEITS